MKLAWHFKNYPRKDKYNQTIWHACMEMHNENSCFIQSTYTNKNE